MENFLIKERLFFEKFNTSKEKLREQNVIYDTQPLPTRLGQITNGTDGNDVYYYNHGSELYNGFAGIDIIEIPIDRSRFELETSRGNVASLKGVVAGYPATIALDNVGCFRHYLPMLDSIYLLIVCYYVRRVLTCFQITSILM